MDTPSNDDWLLSPNAGAAPPAPAVPEPEVISSGDERPLRARRGGILAGAGLAAAGLVAGMAGTFALTHHDGGTATIRDASSSTQQAPRGGLEGEERLAGTVTKVGASSLTVRSPEGTSTYTVTSQTQVIRNGRVATLSDLEVGDAVFLHVYPSGGKTVVERVFAGTMPQRGFGGPPPGQDGVAG